MYRGVQDPGGGVQRVHRRVDALLRDRPGQRGRRVEVGEHGVRGRVGDVVGGHVDRLHRGDRVTAGRGDPLLELAHLVGQGRLVAHGGRHAAEQRGHLGARLGEPEDVVDEQQHVLLLHVAEVLRHRQRGQRDPQPGARRLVHLAEHQRGVLDDAGLGHLQEQVVALAGPLAHAGEAGDTTEVLGDPADHLLDEHRLAHAGAAEQADLAAAHVRGEQVDDLDAGDEHLGLGLELVERRGQAVDRPPLGDVQGRRRDVERLAEHVEDVALGHVADRAPRSGAPVEVTSAPRTRPSVGSSEIARTMLSPMCCSTSRVSVLRVAADGDVHVQRVVDLRHRLRPGTPRRRPGR